VETFYCVDPDAILVVQWIAKKTEKTPNHVIDTCKKQLRRSDEVAEWANKEK
jgi:phage-related protein